jgi:hypothetical protein
MKNQNKRNEAKGPALVAYHVREPKDGKGFWTRIGAAWSHEDGEGFNVQVEVLPIDGRIVLRMPKTDDGQSE